MKKYILIIAAAFALFNINACNDFVNNVESPNNDIEDDQLNSPEDIELLMNGLKAQFARSFSFHSVLSGGLADELEFTRDINSATYVTFQDIDNAAVSGQLELNPSNGSSSNCMIGLAMLRLVADTLVERIENRIDFNDTGEHRTLKNDGLFHGYFFGAIARYFWASYWALEAGDGGGGVISSGPYIPADQLYRDAIELFDKASEYATPYQNKLINAMKARIMLFTGRYSETNTYLANALTAGDPDYEALFSTELQNWWGVYSGRIRTQFHAADRFGDYVYGNPAEAERIPIYYVKGSRQTVTYDKDTVIAGHLYKANDTSNIFYVQQDKYPERESSMKFLTWQEVALMKAEIRIRDGDNSGGLALINEVRASHSLDAITDEDIQNDGNDYLEVLITERDKELCFTGMRLIDQRRFDKWHLEYESWKRLPISQREREANPYL